MTYLDCPHLLGKLITSSFQLKIPGKLDNKIKLFDAKFSNLTDK